MKRVCLLRFALGAILLVLVLGTGCSEKSTWSAPNVVLESVLTSSPPRIDGKALDKEWVSAPELMVAVGDESGNGGGNFYVRMKSVYTVYDTVYLLLQWADADESVFPDRLIYCGQPWRARSCSSDLGLLDASSWTKRSWEIENEDRFALMFEITPASDATGTFASRGCGVACHGNMHPTEGKVDVWYWMAVRTNQVSRCDDMYADSTGLVGDPGDGTWRINWRDPTFVPKYILEGDNGGLSPAKCIYDRGIYARGFNQCDTIIPYSGLVWGDTLNPDGFDYVPGYAIKWPTGSRGDIIAKGSYDSGRWSVELKRAMRPAGHENEDVFFYPDKSYNFALAVMNGSREIHSGSDALILRFSQ